MPGPGPHMMYALGTGQALMTLSSGRFSPHHCLIYALNAFFGPDIGSFTEWLTSTLGLAAFFGSSVETYIHDPFLYIFILGFPLSLLYTRVSRFFVSKGYLDSVSGVPLTVKQCLLLISAGSLSHFFLDHLFEVIIFDFNCTGEWILFVPYISSNSLHYTSSRVFMIQTDPLIPDPFATRRLHLFCIRPCIMGIIGA
ncbi:hypothetical protein HanOQP8_Chr16g0603431 [Helianthus annuus]|nr:hypothetical protein HanOQP8_Chr16g0603431 [Helianthus annuus]